MTVLSRLGTCVTMAGMKVDGTYLKRRRLELGFAQAELARQIKLTPMALSRMERGLSGARLSTLRKLAQALDVPVHHLYAEKLDAAA